MSRSVPDGSLAIRSTTHLPYRPAVQLLLVLFGIFLIAIAAKIQVPFWPVPMTLQTLAIAGLAAAFGLRLGLMTILGYLAAGYMGAPVFAGPATGPLYFVGPTAGFLAGFVVLTAIVGWVADRVRSENVFALFGAMFVGEILVFALGLVWLAYFFVTGSGTTLGVAMAWEKGIQPYLLADLFKIALACAIVPAISSLMRR